MRIDIYISSYILEKETKSLASISRLFDTIIHDFKRFLTAQKIDKRKYGLLYSR